MAKDANEIAADYARREAEGKQETTVNPNYHADLEAQRGLLSWINDQDYILAEYWDVLVKLQDGMIIAEHPNGDLEILCPRPGDRVTYRRNRNREG